MAKQHNESDELLATRYSRALNTDNGEHIKKDLAYYQNRVSHTPGDAITTAFREGERSLALRLLILCGEIKDD